jgi:hypothetical protein
MAISQWKKTGNRFVLFFDILGFKDLVQANSHEAILDKLEVLKNTIGQLKKLGKAERFKRFEFERDQTQSVTFSDSIIFFSKGDTANDILKILVDGYSLWTQAIQVGIPIKGALSYGSITVDFKNSLFFGQPIIDAYLLHEDLQMLTIILDHKFEVRLKELKYDRSINSVLSQYKANLKSGKILHTVVRPQREKGLTAAIVSLKNHYNNVSGKPRIYIDNTMEFFKSLENPST